MTRYLEMPTCNSGKGETLFALIDDSLKNSIPWSNVVAFESDTTNVVIGKHNLVLSCVKVMQPKVFSQDAYELFLLMWMTSLLIYIITFIKMQKEKKSIMNFSCLRELKNRTLHELINMHPACSSAMECSLCLF